MRRRLLLEPIRRLPLRERVYAVLQTAIVSRELSPGTRIQDQEIAEQLGVSRTPVREALQRLESQGLIEMRPGSMTRVTHLRREIARDAIPVVAYLHALAARLAVPHLTKADLKRMREANRRLEVSSKRGDVIGAMQADTDFHRTLVDACGNRELASALDILEPKVRRLEFAVFDLTSDDSLAEHESIIAACAQRDAERVAGLVHENWLLLEERLMRLLFDKDEEEAEV